MKGFSYMIEMVIVVFIFLVFAFSVMKAYHIEDRDTRIIDRKIDHIFNYLDMSGKLRSTACLSRSTSLESEFSKYTDYNFDMSFCTDSCSPYVTPFWKTVVAYNRFLYGCGSFDPVEVRVLVWV